MNTFVYAKRDMNQDGIKVKKNEIGILSNLNGSIAQVTFVCSNTEIFINFNDIKVFEPEKTGDQFSKKVCNVCHRLLDVNEFQKNQNGKNNRTVRRPSCNDCREIIDGKSMTAYEKQQMEKIKPHMIIWQCPICKKRTIPGLTSKVVIDHNHRTGHPRAWICDSCNTGLGRFKDNIELMENAIDYLKKNNNFFEGL